MSAPGPSGRPPNTTWRLRTPPPGSGDSGAIAVVVLEGDLERAFRSLGLAPLEVHAVSLRDLGGVDQVIAARPSVSSCLFMLHAGPAVLRQVLARLERGGIRDAPVPAAVRPSCAEDIGPLLNRALFLACSPLAIDLLLDQARRWAASPGLAQDDDEVGLRSRVLNRLIHPPLVIALGPPNIGKSTLVNTLAGRSVSIVADQPGTTRDHVGVRLDLGGLAVDYVDAPGFAPDHRSADLIQQESQRIALVAAARAALILLCADPSTAFLDNPCPAVPSLRIGLRADLGRIAGRHDLGVSAITGQGIAELVVLIRETLVPAHVLSDPRPWRFWE